MKNFLISILIVLFCVSCSNPVDNVSKEEIKINGIANEDTMAMINELDQLCWFIRIHKTSESWECWIQIDVGEVRSRSKSVDGSSLNDVLNKALLEARVIKRSSSL